MREKLENLLARTSKERGKGYAWNLLRQAIRKQKSNETLIIKNFHKRKLYRRFRIWQNYVKDIKRKNYLLNKCTKRLGELFSPINFFDPQESWTHSPSAHSSAQLN